MNFIYILQCFGEFCDFKAIMSKASKLLSVMRREPKQRQSVEVQEAIAMDTFRQRVSVNRVSNISHYGYTMRAPSFDYANWKPYGTVRSYEGQVHKDFMTQASGLAPWVRAVVMAGCEGQEERRWKALTQSAEQHSQIQSRAMSRSQSRDELVPASR